MVVGCSYCCVPMRVSWRIIHKTSGRLVRALSQPRPASVEAVLGEGQRDGLEVLDGRLSGRVGGLLPLVALAAVAVVAVDLGVADLEVEQSVRGPVALQISQDGEERSLGVVRVLGEGILLAGEDTAHSVVTKYLDKLRSYTVK